jgi:hypothetical protein
VAAAHPPPRHSANPGAGVLLETLVLDELGEKSPLENECYLAVLPLLKLFQMLASGLLLFS